MKNTKSEIAQRLMEITANGDMLVFFRDHLGNYHAIKDIVIEETAHQEFYGIEDGKKVIVMS